MKRARRGTGTTSPFLIERPFIEVDGRTAIDATVDWIAVLN